MSTEDFSVAWDIGMIALMCLSTGMAVSVATADGDLIVVGVVSALMFALLFTVAML